MANSRSVNSDEAMRKLRAAVRELCYEFCHDCPSWDRSGEKCSLRGKTECFINNHWKLLEETK